MQHRPSHGQGTLSLLLAFSLCLGVSVVPPSSARPTEFDWQTAAPEKHGLSLQQLIALQERLAAKGDQGLPRHPQRQDRLRVVRPGPRRQRRRTTPRRWPRPIVGGLSLGGRSDRRPDRAGRPGRQVRPAWKDDPRKSKITIRQLGSHTSGLEDAEADGLPHEKLTGWKGDFWKRLEPPNDPFTISPRPDAAAVRAGRRSSSTATPASPCSTLCRHRGAARTRRTRTSARCCATASCGRSACPTTEWSVGYGKTVHAWTACRWSASWGGGNYTARAAARVGRLMLREGDWDGQRLLQRGQPSARSRQTPACPATAAWAGGRNAGGRYAEAAAGRVLGRRRRASDPARRAEPEPDRGPQRRGARRPRQDHHDVARTADLFEPLRGRGGREPKHSAAPYPPSPVITGIDWAPKETIVRKAKGSDNWPMTWADDDHLYTAYGDGNGFEPDCRRSSSLGFAEGRGGRRPSSRGVNIRAPRRGEQGDGDQGQEGQRHAHGGRRPLPAGSATPATRSSPGRPTTARPGPGPTGSSPPASAARRSSTSARTTPARATTSSTSTRTTPTAPTQPPTAWCWPACRRAASRSAAAYEFFKRLDAGRASRSGRKDVAERGAVFTHPGKCYRSGITYNAGLEALPLVPDVSPESSRRRASRAASASTTPRSRGGRGRRSSSPKAGTSAPARRSSFPTKWMSADGQTLHLVFSGDDSFSVRRAELTLSGD